MTVTDHEIVTSSVDGRVRLYDLRAGELTADTLGECALTSVALTRDGQCLLSSCSDATNNSIVVPSLSAHPTLPKLLSTASGHVKLWGPPEEPDK
ncbi:hypothetical protein B566_EDAN015939, partial [Ephemera danica]